MLQKVHFLYRDASNYKFTLGCIIQTETALKVGDTVNYLDLGFTQDTFHDEVVGYHYDEDDHPLLEVTEVEDLPSDYLYGSCRIFTGEVVKDDF